MDGSINQSSEVIHDVKVFHFFYTTLISQWKMALKFVPGTCPRKEIGNKSVWFTSTSRIDGNTTKSATGTTKTSAKSACSEFFRVHRTHFHRAFLQARLDQSGVAIHPDHRGIRRGLREIPTAALGREQRLERLRALRLIGKEETFGCDNHRLVDLHRLHFGDGSVEGPQLPVGQFHRQKLGGNFAFFPFSSWGRVGGSRWVWRVWRRRTRRRISFWSVSCCCCEWDGCRGRRAPRWRNIPRLVGAPNSVREGRWGWYKRARRRESPRRGDGRQFPSCYDPSKRSERKSYSCNDRSINQSINQSVDQSRNRAVDESINQSINQSIEVHQSINQSIDRAVDEPVSQSINQSVDEWIDQSIDRPNNGSMKRKINQSINRVVSPVVSIERFFSKKPFYIPLSTKICPLFQVWKDFSPEHPRVPYTWPWWSLRPTGTVDRPTVPESTAETAFLSQNSSLVWFAGRCNEYCQTASDRRHAAVAGRDWPPRRSAPTPAPRRAKPGAWAPPWQSPSPSADPPPAPWNPVCPSIPSRRSRRAACTACRQISSSAECCARPWRQSRSARHCWCAHSTSRPSNELNVSPSVISWEEKIRTIVRTDP